ncbi:MAG: hypothetical protein U1E10_19050 [Bdellovibrionales bacterium]|nr:hypothetical protein [Bdellovibrionales bacterium]
MRLIEKVLISVVLLVAAYMAWLSPLAYLVAAWPTPTVMIMLFAPVLLFFIPSVILRFLPIDRKIKDIFIAATIAGALFILFTLKQSGTTGPLDRFIRNDESKIVCSAKVFDVSDRKKRIQGHCTFQLFTPNQGKVGRFSQKGNANECVESLASACLNFCGKLTEPGGSPVNTLIVNFGPKENFDEVHLPFAATQSLALVSCDDEYFYKQRQTPELIENLNN